jgi:hypothetical protein
VLVVDHREEIYSQCHDEQSLGRYLANLLLTATEADRGCPGFAMKANQRGLINSGNRRFHPDRSVRQTSSMGLVA